MSQTKFVSVAKAREVADALGDAEFSQAVAKAETMELSTVEVQQDSDSGDIALVQPTGVMVGWFQPDNDWGTQFKVNGGEQDSHITICYLGNVQDFDLAQQRTLIGVVAEVCQSHTAMRGIVSGTQVFDLPDGSGAWVANVQVDGLVQFRNDLSAALTTAGITVDDTYEFTPHLTLAYLDADDTPPDVTLSPTEIYINDITVAIAGLHFRLPLQSRGDGPDEPLIPYDQQVMTPFVPVIKSLNPEKRFTLAPVYIPDRLDAHGDLATADDLQEALWEFSKGDRTIQIQHDKELRGHGEMVELMSIPWEHTVKMPDADGNMVDMTFPAGTPWMGVQWDEPAFELVKKGYFRGYSIGGRAAMVEIGGIE